MSAALESTDAKNRLEDLSGVALTPGENPYHALIAACSDDPAKIQALYSTHRVARNGQQREKFLSPDFRELIIDPFLLRIENPHIEPNFSDPRFCCVLWARPPEHVIRLAARLQAMLKEAAPSLWLMPPQRMHMTTLEVAFSRTAAEAAALVDVMRPHLPRITGYTHGHRARLVKPMLSYDLAAIAVSFLPAAGESVVSPPPVAPKPDDRAGRDDGYTYHHLRRDIFGLVGGTGVDIASRYVVPSAHMTLGRYLSQDDHANAGARAAWIQKIEDINAWLEEEVWHTDDGEFIGEWIVGQERGLDARAGQLWYGGGRTVMAGEGF